MFSELDIKDGFWKMVFADGKQINFVYILLNHQEDPIEIVILLAR